MHNSVIYHNPNHINKHAIDKVIIWLHGIGANGEHFVEYAKALNLSCAVKFIFPNAPQRPVTVNQGNIRTSWFDILEKRRIHRKINVDELKISANRILTMIDNELKNGILASNIIIVGFSQGGAVAYHVALSHQKLGGLIAISTYLATDTCFNQQENNLPILICHGKNDLSVAPDFAIIAKTKLIQLGFSANIQFYETAHCICGDKIKDIKAWIEQIFI